MLRRILLAAAVAVAVGFALFWWLTTPAPVPSNLLLTYTPNLANGLTTFNAGGCSSCHAVPGQPDRLRLGGGLAIPSPFGTFYAPNISPDPADGIGRWTEAEFVGAVDRKSTRLNSSHLVRSYAVFCLKKKQSARTRLSSASVSRIPGVTAQCGSVR